jgi:hypothetical protein
MNGEEDKLFLQRARAALDAAAQNLDAPTAGRLRAARRRALAGAGPKSHPRAAWWLPLGSAAAAGLVLVLGAMLWLGTPNGRVPVASMDDMELLTAKDNPEFYAELEFYRWLASQRDAG